EKWSASTAPWPTNGPTHASTSAIPSAAPNFPFGCTPTITTAATPHSAANHPPAAYLTCQVTTASSGSASGGGDGGTAQYLVTVGVGAIQPQRLAGRHAAQRSAQPHVELVADQFDYRTGGFTMGTHLNRALDGTRECGSGGEDRRPSGQDKHVEIV